MEQKLNITKYMIDTVKELEALLDDCQKSIVEIKDSKSYAKAASNWSLAKGMLSGCYMVVNNLEECESNNVFQDMLDVYEERVHKMADVIRVMKPSYFE